MRIGASKCRIVLIGLMASGKTSVGQAISSRTGWPYLDNDSLVAEAAGADRLALLKERGVEELRRYERLALDQILEAEAPLIASIAGGVLLEEPASEALRARRDRDAFAVWLRAPLSVIAERIVNDAVERPWIDLTDPVASVTALAAQREPVYQRVSDLIIDTHGVDPEDVAAEILSAAAVASAPA